MESEIHEQDRRVNKLHEIVGGLIAEVGGLRTEVNLLKAASKGTGATANGG